MFENSKGHAATRSIEEPVASILVSRKLGLVTSMWAKHSVLDERRRIGCAMDTGWNRQSAGAPIRQSRCVAKKAQAACGALISGVKIARSLINYYPLVLSFLDFIIRAMPDSCAANSRV
jgi:hypothetical protein